MQAPENTHTNSNMRPALHRIARREESMSHALIWFERKFDFSFPVELLPNLCARLRGVLSLNP
jgi:hypothetical protein